MSDKKRLFGKIEVGFDLTYLTAALIMGIFMLYTAGPSEPRKTAGFMALVLVMGDSLHLLPRVAALLSGDTGRWQKAMGIGKLAASLTMTMFYLLLWKIGLMLFSPATLWTAMTRPLWLLAALRILLCLPPQNGWLSDAPSVRWGIYRNLPFLVMGGMVAALFFFHMGKAPAADFMWLAIVLSFGFYMPVVLFAQRRPAVGMLMLPKTCAYLWMLSMCVKL